MQRVHSFLSRTRLKGTFGTGFWFHFIMKEQVLECSHLRLGTPIKDVSKKWIYVCVDGFLVGLPNYSEVVGVGKEVVFFVNSNRAAQFIVRNKGQHH